MHNREEIKRLHRLAFGEEEGEIIENLVASLLLSKATISINIEKSNKIVAHCLFTPFYLEEDRSKKCYLLAPLAVLPEYQGQGLARELIEKGIEKLNSLEAEGIFVFGDPALYSRFGFVQTNISTPYPEVLTMPEAFMLLELKKASLAGIKGKTSAVEEFMKVELWDTRAYTEVEKD